MPRIGERGWIHSDAKVVDDAVTPEVWTVLDLSSVVGKNHAFIFLAILNKSTIEPSFYYLRPRTVYGTGECNINYPQGLNTLCISEGCTGHIALETDENGKIQWKAVDPVATDMRVLGYIR